MKSTRSPVIQVTSSMCLGEGACAPIPKADALAFMIKQRVYLEEVPPIADLRDVWFPWSWGLAHGESARAAPGKLDDDELRAECFRVFGILEKRVEARE